MSFIKKLWKDRVSEYPNRRTINDGYTTKRVTVGRDEGNISEEGTPFNAANMNDLEDRIYAAIEQGGGGGGGSGTYDYDDLMNKPTINSVQLAGNKTTADLHISYNDLEDTPNLANVAETGDYNDLINTPTVNTAYSVVAGSTMPAGFPLPVVIRRNNVVQVVFGFQIPAGTYTSSDILWNIAPKPVATARALIALGGGFSTVNISASGEIKFNGTQTLSAATWFVGQIMYLSDG